MATQQSQLAQHGAVTERRLYGRVTPVLLTYVSFGENSGANGDGNIGGITASSNGGMGLDVSESGLAVATALAIPDKALLNVSIAEDKTHPLIELRGRVVWMSESKRRVGLQFV